MEVARHKIVLLLNDEAFNKLQSGFKLAQKTLKEYKKANMGDFLVDAIEAWLQTTKAIAEIRRCDVPDTNVGEIGGKQ